MPKAVYLVVGAVVVLAAGVASWGTWQGLREREPVYKGQRLTAWLVECRDGSGHYRPGRLTEAHLAVREIGTNAVPTLLRMAQARDSALTRAWIAFLRKHPSIPFQPLTAQEYHGLSKSGFVELGPIGRPAVPALKGLLKDPEGEVREAAGFDLGRMGAAAQEAVPALIECLEDPEPRVRSQATRSLGELHLEPGLAVPALLRSLDRPGVPKSETIDALAQFGPEAKAAVPALCRVLEDQAESAWLARCGAICALETIGAEQELVIPALARELNDHHPAVRSMATNFLLKYHPAAAARAGLTAAVPHP